MPSCRAEPPVRRRSRTVRAAALVTVGLGVAACDDTPPDLSDRSEARVDACRAAHLRLGEDPARCEALEGFMAREQAEDRPQFRTVAACEQTFGRGACEGETLASSPPLWRPALAGWATAGTGGWSQPVLQDAAGRFWALPNPERPLAGGTLATQGPPRNIAAPEAAPATRSAAQTQYAYYHLAPIYPDQASCTAEWKTCEQSNVPLPNRFATEESCKASWSQCLEVSLPAAALAMVVAAQPPPAGSTGTTGTTGGGGGVRPGWWFSYNAGYRDRYARGLGPRYQGWSWTGNYRPVAAYRPAAGTGPLQAWDSSSRSLGRASRMAYSSSGSVSRPSSTISRAGFGSTGRSYSSGG